MRVLFSAFVQNSLYFVFFLGIVFCYVWASAFKKQLKMNGWQLLLFIVYTFVIGGLSAHFFARFEQWVSPNHFESNLRIYGPIYIMWLAYIIPCKFLHSDPKTTADICTPGLIISLITIRINCFYQGCCAGMMIPGSEMRYPIRELEIVFQIIILVIIARKVMQRKQYDGTLYPLYMFWYGLIRFLYEFFREPENLLFGNVHAPHVWSLISMIAGAIAYMALKNRAAGKTAKKQRA